MLSLSFDLSFIQVNIQLCILFTASVELINSYLFLFMLFIVLIDILNSHIFSLFSLIYFVVL